MNYMIMPGLKFREGVRVGIKPDQVIAAICDYYGIEQKALFGQRRDRDLVEARHIAIYTIRKHCKKGSEWIGRMFNRDHTTVLYACQKVKNLMETEVGFKNDVHNIFSQI